MTLFERIGTWGSLHLEDQQCNFRRSVVDVQRVGSSDDRAVSQNLRRRASMARRAYGHWLSDTVSSMPADIVYSINRFSVYPRLCLEVQVLRCSSASTRYMVDLPLASWLFSCSGSNSNKVFCLLLTGETACQALWACTPYPSASLMWARQCLIQSMRCFLVSTRLLSGSLRWQVLSWQEKLLQTRSRD